MAGCGNLGDTANGVYRGYLYLKEFEDKNNYSIGLWL